MPSSEYLDGLVGAHLRHSAELKILVAEQCLHQIREAAGLISSAFRRGCKLLLCGNGGSAADCQHMATEFMNQLFKSPRRPPWPAISLTTDTSFITAYGNDADFAGVFERQVLALGREGDVLIAISTSGESVNVIRAAEAARAAGLVTVILTGSAGRLSGLADVAIQVPSDNTQLIQECHIAIEHTICELVERELAVPDAADR